MDNTGWRSYLRRRVARPQGLVADLVWCAVGVIVAAGLLVPPRTVGDRPGLRRFLTGEPGERLRIAQRFRMNARNLSALEIRASAVGSVGGRFRLTLSDREFPNERSIDVSAADLVREARYVFTFEPIQDSKGHEFQVDFQPLPDDPGRGVALWATKGDRLDDGALLINGQPRWASLAFQTQTSAAPPFRALLGADDPQRPAQWLALVGLFGSWIALRFLLKEVWADCR